MRPRGGGGSPGPGCRRSWCSSGWTRARRRPRASPPSPARRPSSSAPWALLTACDRRVALLPHRPSPGRRRCGAPRCPRGGRRRSRSFGRADPGACARACQPERPAARISTRTPGAGGSRSSGQPTRRRRSSSAWCRAWAATTERRALLSCAAWLGRRGHDLRLRRAGRARTADQRQRRQQRAA